MEIMSSNAVVNDEMDIGVYMFHVKNNSTSFYRRQLVIPFDKNTYLKVNIHFIHRIFTLST